MTSSRPSPAQAAAELLIRRRARTSAREFARAVDIPGKPASDDPDTEAFAPIESVMAAHHRLILDKLDEITQKPHGRLMLFMPPGSAKSTYASVVFPAYILGQRPGTRLIMASYGDDLARKMGRRVRSIIKQPRYQHIWNTHLLDGSTAAQDFALANGSEYMACGILSGITGNRAAGVIIDDPIKGREQADSSTFRTKTWDAYEDDLKTRLLPGGWVVLIQTRWHEDDIAGRILPDTWKGESGSILCKDGNVWDVVCLQARCEVDGDPLGRRQGEYLWPEWFDRKHWAQFENNPRTWAALYQQIPVPTGGGFFKPALIIAADAIPIGTRFVRAWDLGATEGGGDPTAGVLLGTMPDGRYLIGDVIHMQKGPHEVEAALKATASRDGRGIAIYIPQDPGQAGKSQIAYLALQLEGYRVHGQIMSGSKITRAEPFAAQVNVGNVVMLRAGWNQPLIQELETFPVGRHDDRVDALSLGFDALIDRQGRAPSWGTLD
jgi:predicted phage terminase large subunit-like protein